jgi:hypothetical protein
MKNKSLFQILYGYVLFWVVIVCVINVAIGCSSRKKTTEENKQDIKIENSSNSQNSENSEANIKTKIEVVVDDKNQTVTTKKTYSPVDATKPASVIDPTGKKHDLNNANYTEETTTQKNNSQSRNSDNSEEFRKMESSGKKETTVQASGKSAIEKMDLDKSGFSLGSWFWLVLLIIIAIGLIYLNYRFKLIKRVTAFFA